MDKSIEQSPDNSTDENDPSPPAPSAPSRPGERRLLWLDALRGIAALVVVFEHLLDTLLPDVRQTASPWFDFGRYGVFLFFIVSGYVIPASLERRGSVREFWIGRAFRLYPLWAVAAVLGLAFALGEVYWGVPAQLSGHPWTSGLAHLTMLQDLLGVPNVLNVFWTLSYEMAFYLIVTAMFVAGVHRASMGTALAFGVAAPTVGVALPAGLLSATLGPGAVVVVTVLVGAGLVAVIADRGPARRCGVALLGATALALLAFNSRIGAVESFAIMATMFAGTAVYRLQRRMGDRRFGRRSRDWLIVLVPLLTVAAGVRLAAGWAVPAGHVPLGWGWPAAVSAAWATFALAVALRRRRMPRLLPWLGVISYSIYLLHQLPLQVFRRLIGDPAGLNAVQRIGWAGVIVTVVVVCGALGYRWIERPMQRLGRRIARRTRGDRPIRPAAGRPTAVRPAAAEPRIGPNGGDPAERRVA